MDTAMTYIRLAEQDNRKALAESVGKKKCKDPCKFYHRYSVINSCSIVQLDSSLDSS